MKTKEVHENICNYGVDAISDRDLLSVAIGVDDIKVDDTVHSWTKYDIEQWMMLNKIGKKKATQLVAMFELGRRASAPVEVEKTFFRSPDEVFRYFAPKLRDLGQEVFVVALMNAQKRLIAWKRVSIGSSTSTVVDIPVVMRMVLAHGAHSFIVLHNHPSGNDHVSQADIQLSKRLYEAGKNIDTYMEDSIVIAGHSFTSLRAGGYF